MLTVEEMSSLNGAQGFLEEYVPVFLADENVLENVRVQKWWCELFSGDVNIPQS